MTTVASFAIQTDRNFPMKVIIKSFLIAIAICAGGFGLSLLLAGCATAAGDVFANALLNKVDSSSAGLTAQKTAVADLNQVGVDLKAFAAGTLTPYELGNIRGKLSNDKIAVSANSEAVNDVTSILNIFAQSVAGVNGLVLPAQSQVQNTIANAVAGLNASIQTYEGQWNATNPGAWPAPTTP